MKKIKIISLILISILMFSGCSVNKSTEVDKATQQKNITKVQNDINEIIDKDYSYIKFNLGRPYATKYYVDLDEYNDSSDIKLDILQKKLEAQMIYPKEGYESSALYVQIDNGKAIGVKTDTFTGSTSGSKFIPDYVEKCDVVIDFYEKSDVLDDKKIDSKNLDKYINETVSDLNKDLEVNTSNAIAYSMDGKKNIHVYLLDDGSNKERILAVYEKDKKIVNISLGNDDKIINELLKEFK